MTPLRRLLPCLFLLVASVPARAADTDKYLPDRTQGVITVHIKQLLESPLLKEHTTAIKQAFKDLNVGQAALNLIGFDPFSDVERVVVAFSGNPDNDQAVFLLQGTFDTAKVQAAADKAAKEGKDTVQRHKLNDHTFYAVKLEADGATVYIGPLDQGMLIASPDRDSVIEALDKKAGRRKSEVRKDVQSLVAKIDPRHAVAGPNDGGMLTQSPRP